MQDFPLPFDDDRYDAVNFTGASTYFETDEIHRELCRVVRPGGFVVFSQRDDIIRRLNCEERLRELEQIRLWRRRFGTEPMPHFPNHPEYGDRIEVQYFVYEVL